MGLLPLARGDLLGPRAGPTTRPRALSCPLYQSPRSAAAISVYKGQSLVRREPRGAKGTAFAGGTLAR